MEFLLQELWVRLEAPAHRVRVSDAEADRAFNLSKRESFESERDFRDFLEKSKMTEADARFQIRSNELYLKLRRHATKRARSDTGKRRLADRFERRLRRKWRMRTACGLRHRSAECGHTVPAHPLPEGP